MSSSHEIEGSSNSSSLNSGIRGLDAMLDGAFPQGKVILVLGEPGAGKTIFCSQFLHYGATEKNEKSIFIGMNELQHRFFNEMRTIGMDFDSLEKSGMFSYIDATGLRRIPQEAKVGRIPVGGKELELVNLIDIIQEAIEKFSPKRIVIDSISDLIFRFPTVEERRPVVLDLVETLESSKATCLMTSELISTGNGRAIQAEEYLAEGVILLRTIQKGVRSLQILKMRGSKIDTRPRPYVIKGNGIEVYSTEEVYQ
jgi:circadian clock protein KaiC